MLSQFEQYLVEQLKTFGYPEPGDNIRVKPYNLYDEITCATGIQEYYAFVNTNLSQFVRNRVFPISSNEIILINKIRAAFELGTYVGAGFYESLQRAFIEIAVDDRVKLKIPLLECAEFQIINQQDAAATSFDNAFVTNISRTRKLQFPILINSSSNVKVKIGMSSNASTNLNNKTLRIELSGVKFDKIEPFVYDPAKGNKIERLSFTMYDNLQLQTSSYSYDLFSTQNKDSYDFSKVFPLGDKETFQIENIEFFIGANQTTSSLPDYDLLSQLRSGVLKIYVDDVEFMNFANDEMFTLLIIHASSFIIKSRYYSNKGYTLETPILIPAASRVKATLELPGLTGIGSGNYLTVLFKGTLQRLIA